MANANIVARRTQGQRTMRVSSFHPDFQPIIVSPSSPEKPLAMCCSTRPPTIVAFPSLILLLLRGIVAWSAPILCR